MSSRSSNSRGDRVAIGRVSGHRGGAGELTVRVRAGDAQRWVDTPRVWLRESTGASEEFVVRAARAYRDRLVLAFEGIDDPSAAAALRGRAVEVVDEDRADLAAGEWQPEDIEGLTVVDESGEPIGRAIGVWPTAGVDLLCVRPHGAVADTEVDDELLVPMADEYVRAVDVEERRIVLRLPDDLRTLNLPERRKASGGS